MQRINHTRRGLTMAAAVALTATVGFAHSPSAEAADITRLSGSDRIATGLQVFENNRDVFTGKTAVVAGIGGFADALSASPLAAAYRGPVLSTQAADLDSRVIASLKKQGITNVVVMGGAGAVSPTAAAELKAAGMSVERLGGSDRYETAALAALKTMGVRGVDSVPVFIADGSGYADALSAGSAAVKEGGVVILSRNGKLDPGALQFLNDNASKVVAIGGSAAKAIKAAGVEGESIVGSDRYDTAAKVANRFFAGADSVVLASGEGYGDAVSGSPLAALTGAPLLLTRGTSLPAQVATYLAANKPDITVLGGTGAIATAVATKADTIADTGSVTAPTPTPKPTGTTTPTPPTGPAPIGPGNGGGQTGAVAASGSDTVSLEGNPTLADLNKNLKVLNVTNPGSIKQRMTAKPTNGGPALEITDVGTTAGTMFFPKLTAAPDRTGAFTYDLMNGTQKIGTYTLNVQRTPTAPTITGGGGVAVGGRMTLTASATGGNLTYSWLKGSSENGPFNVVATTTTPTYSKTYTASDAGFYKVQVSNSNGTATSAGAVNVYAAEGAVQGSKLIVNTPASGKVGTPQTITGKLTAADGTTAIQGPVSVTFQGKTVETTTNGEGLFSATVTPTAAGTGQTATASFAGDPTHTGTTASTTTGFTVAKATPGLNIAAPDRADVNTAVDITGTATALGIPATVTFWDIAVSGATETGGGTQVGTGAVDSNGTLTGKVTFASSGARKLVARLSATANTETTASNTETVTVP